MWNSLAYSYLCKHKEDCINQSHVGNCATLQKKKKKKKANNVERYEEAKKVDQRDQGTKIMSKRTIGEPKSRLEKRKQKQKRKSVTESTMQNIAKKFKI